MKLVAFTDPHASIVSMRAIEKLVKKEKPDAVICTGDITVFEQHIEEMMQWFGSLKLPVFLLHGNHEEESIVRKLCSFHKNITFMHKKSVQFKGHTLFGWGGGGFSYTEPAFERWAKSLPKKIPNCIFLTHQPIYNTKLDVVAKHHVGNRSFRKFVKEHQEILLHISGHIHEGFNKTDKVGKVKTMNPGPSGKVVRL